MTKQELRKTMREAKAMHSHEELIEMSNCVCRAITSEVHWQNASTILLYHPLPDEVDVTSIIALGKDEGKIILLPAVTQDNLVIRIYENDETLQAGAYNIMEPMGGQFTDYACIDTVFVPGMAFDKKGNRLGRGKGYYDRLLPLLVNAYRIGVCFPFQLLDDVPHEAHDQRMDSIVHSIDI